MRTCSVGVIALALGISSAAAQELFHQGDVFVGGSGGQIERFHSDAQSHPPLTIENGSQIRGMCFDLDGNMYAADFANRALRKIDRDGRLVGRNWASGFSSNPESCVVDADGNVFTSEVDGENRIRKFDRDGSLIETFRPRTEERGVDWIDLAADQCTMFYTSESSTVLRYDVCRERQLGDFARQLQGPCFALRIRENGEVMVACRPQVYRFAADGRTLDTYPFANEGLFAMNLDPDGKHFWTGGFETGNVYKVAIADGAGSRQAVLRALRPKSTRPAGLVDFLLDAFGSQAAMTGLAVFGERTAAVAVAKRRQEEEKRQAALRAAEEERLRREAEQARLAEDERRRQEALRLAEEERLRVEQERRRAEEERRRIEEERRRIEEAKRRRQGAVTFAPLSAVELGRVAPGGSGQGALDLVGTEIDGWSQLLVSTDLDALGIVLEIETADGWKTLKARPVVLPLDPDGLRRWAVRARVGGCTRGLPPGTAPRLHLESPGPGGAPSRVDVALVLQVEASPWLRCFGEALAWLLGFVAVGVVIHGFVSPSRFGQRVGVVLSPEADLGEGFFHPIRAQRGSGSGFYRDARIHVGRDYRLTRRTAGALARLRADKARVLIEPTGAASLLRRTADDEWEAVPAEESWMRPGVTYRDEGSTVFFELSHR